MKMKIHAHRTGRLFAALAFVCLIAMAGPAASVPIPVNFDGAYSSTGLPRLVPFLVNSTAQNLFLRFLVPDAPLIGSINSMSLTVFLHDDSDAQNEAAIIGLALPGSPDLSLGIADVPDLQGTTSASPFVFTHALDAFEIAVFEGVGSLDNGAFRVRISRCCGDFFVTGGSVAIDANLVPEPSSISLFVGALMALALIRTRRKRSRTG